MTMKRVWWAGSRFGRPARGEGRTSTPNGCERVSEVRSTTRVQDEHLVEIARWTPMRKALRGPPCVRESRPCLRRSSPPLISAIGQRIRRVTYTSTMCLLRYLP